ncbi:hypothetical protein DIPPA_08460 [Diplonema papillatum]|nr:hypothetical protein DIPPA_08460 [Diplonema papillatum]
MAAGVLSSFPSVSVSKPFEAVPAGAPWYLSIMPPRARQPAAKFAWLDPTAINACDARRARSGTDHSPP